MDKIILENFKGDIDIYTRDDIKSFNQDRIDKMYKVDNYFIEQNHGFDFNCMYLYTQTVIYYPSVNVFKVLYNEYLTNGYNDFEVFINVKYISFANNRKSIVESIEYID
jgi:hypothetical protein